MRFGLFFLILLTAQFPCAGWAASVLEGTVLSFDQKKGYIVVLQPLTHRAVTVVAPPKRIPESLGVGAQVRITGRFSTTNPNLFNAKKIEAGPGGKINDPTGVRSRLHRGKKKPWMESFK